MLGDQGAKSRYDCGRARRAGVESESDIRTNVS